MFKEHSVSFWAHLWFATGLLFIILLGSLLIAGSRPAAQCKRGYTWLSGSTLSEPDISYNGCYPIGYQPK